MHATRRTVRASPSDDVDRHLIRDAQRVIESNESLVRLRNAQEEAINERAASG